MRTRLAVVGVVALLASLVIAGAATPQTAPDLRFEGTLGAPRATVLPDGTEVQTFPVTGVLVIGATLAPSQGFFFATGDLRSSVLSTPEIVICLKDVLGVQIENCVIGGPGIAARGDWRIEAFERREDGTLIFTSKFTFCLGRNCP